MVDVERVIKNTIKNGKIMFGTKQVKKVIDNGSAKIIVMAKNCPSSSNISDLANKKNIPLYNFDSNSIDLGYTCGKNFAVSVFAVLDDGDSNIYQLIKKGNI